MRLHVVKRDSCPLWKMLLLYVGAVAAALLLGAVLLLALGVNPMEYYSKMFTMGMVGNKIAYKAFENYLKVFVPLVLTAVGLSLAFKMRFWNIGGEGQFIVGAIVAAVVAFKAGAVLPGAVTLLLMCLAAMAAAGAYGAIAAALKVRFGTNETLLTLMLNYIALYALIFLGETKAEWNFLLNPESARPTFGSFASLASFPGISIGKFNLNVCVILTFVIGVLVFIYLKYTKHGYEIAVIGESENTARYAGMNVGWVIMRTMFLSGAIAGVVGFLLVSGANNTLYSGVAAGAGFTAITVAWLAQLNPFAMVGISALLAVLQKGADTLNTQMGIPASLSDVITGVLLFFMLGCEFFINYKLVFRGAEERHKRKEAAK